MAQAIKNNPDKAAAIDYLNPLYSDEHPRLEQEQSHRQSREQEWK